MRDIERLEIRRGRSRLVLEKIIPGPLLKSLHAGVSFFYKVSLNGSVRCMTSDPEEARAIWRGCHRYLCTFKSSTAEVLP